MIIKERNCDTCKHEASELNEGACVGCHYFEHYEEKAPEMVDHPNHYNRDGSMECIEEMVQVFGFKRTMDFCLLNVWKYRYRAADKGGVEDMKKSDWYMRMYVELDKRMRRGDVYGDAE